MKMLLILFQVFSSVIFSYKKTDFENLLNILLKYINSQVINFHINFFIIYYLNF